MKKLLLIFALIVFTLMAETKEITGQTLIHYWNFNNSTSESALLTPTLSLSGTSSITHITGGTSVIQITSNTTGQGFETANVNARNSDEALSHLRFNNPIGGALIFALPTMGFKDIVVKYETRRSGSGAGTQLIEYTVDGTNYIPFTTVTTTDIAPALVSLDFSSLSSVDENSNFKIRITFEAGAGGTVGNNRFDNFTVDGSSTSSDVTKPTVSNVSISSLTTFEVIFNESVTSNSATNLANYSLSPSGTINSISYDDQLKKATLSVSGIVNGLTYIITVNGVTDLAFNTMTTAVVSSGLIFNSANPDLIITEIMYNALNVPEADPLEFIEVYNNSASAIQAGGLRIKDGNNFDYSLPSIEIPSKGFLLLASDKVGAELFYTGSTFVDLPGSGNMLSNGGELIQLRNSLNQIIDELTYDDVAPWPLNADEKGYSLELFTVALDNSQGQNWGIPSTLVKALNSTNIYATPGSFTPALSPISFSTDKTNANENAGVLSIPVTIAFSSTSELISEVSIVGGTAIAGTDYTYTKQFVTFPANSTASQLVTLQILENTLATEDRYLVIQLGSVTNGSLGSIKQHIVFIKDNDRPAIVRSNALNISYHGNFKVPETGSSTEISAYDPSSKRLFVVNSLLNRLEILNFSDPSAISRITTINMAPFGAGLNSVAVKNGIVAIAIENTTTANGKIAFFNIEGVHLKSVDAGNLPDMVCFSPDGKYVLTANEAQPIFYSPTLSDPEGSVTIVDISGGIEGLTQSNVTQVNFNAFDNQMERLKSEGVRIFGIGSTVSQDLEPEYITISDDSKKAWVTLQENNAIAIIDLETKTVTDVKALGYKDHSLAQNSFDASDVSGTVFFGNWKVKGMYMPDAIASYKVNGIEYVITANEGDAREYTGITDEVTFSSLNLDPIAFPDAAILKNNSLLGRLAVTNKTGDIDGDGDFDEVYSFGARSFTIWNGATGAKVFDSGDQLERITAEDPTWGAFFNTNNSSGTPSRKNRSDNKGPEPEGVATAYINGKHYAFIALERIGGVITYDVTDPTAPIYVAYNNNRSNPVVATNDFGAEGILYISAKDSPIDTALVVLSNEISATVSIYKLEGIINVATPIVSDASDFTASSFIANWSSVQGATGYQLDVSTDNFETFLTGYNSKSVTSNAVTITDLASNATYQYRVRAVNGFNISLNSNKATALTLPPSPEALAASEVTGISLKANWSSVIGATGYRLDVSADDFETFVVNYEDKAVSGTSENVIGLEDDNTYTYRVRAEIGDNLSANSNSITVLITSIENGNQSLSFIAYPNPANSRIEFSEVSDFELQTQNGIKVKSGKMATGVTVSDLIEGIYLLKDSKGRTAKIIIKHQ